jgi:hypothetical protein
MEPARRTVPCFLLQILRPRVVAGPRSECYPQNMLGRQRIRRPKTLTVPLNYAQQGIPERTQAVSHAPATSFLIQRQRERTRWCCAGRAMIWALRS